MNFGIIIQPITNTKIDDYFEHLKNLYDKMLTLHNEISSDLHDKQYFDNDIVKNNYILENVITFCNNLNCILDKIISLYFRIFSESKPDCYYTSSPISVADSLFKNSDYNDNIKSVMKSEVEYVINYIKDSKFKNVQKLRYNQIANIQKHDFPDFDIDIKCTKDYIPSYTVIFKNNNTDDNIDDILVLFSLVLTELKEILNFIYDRVQYYLKIFNLYNDKIFISNQIVGLNKNNEPDHYEIEYRYSGNKFYYNVLMKEEYIINLNCIINNSAFYQLKKFLDFYLEKKEKTKLLSEINKPNIQYNLNHYKIKTNDNNNNSHQNLFLNMLAKNLNKFDCDFDVDELYNSYFENGAKLILNNLVGIQDDIKYIFNNKKNDDIDAVISIHKTISRLSNNMEINDKKNVIGHLLEALIDMLLKEIINKYVNCENYQNKINNKIKKLEEYVQKLPISYIYYFDLIVYGGDEHKRNSVLTILKLCKKSQDEIVIRVTENSVLRHQIEEIIDSKHLPNIKLQFQS